MDTSNENAKKKIENVRKEARKRRKDIEISGRIERQRDRDRLRERGREIVREKEEAHNHARGKGKINKPTGVLTN